MPRGVKEEQEIHKVLVNDGGNASDNDDGDAPRPAGGVARPKAKTNNSKRDVPINMYGDGCEDTSSTNYNSDPGEEEEEDGSLNAENLMPVPPAQAKKARFPPGCSAVVAQQRQNNDTHSISMSSTGKVQQEDQMAVGLASESDPADPDKQLTASQMDDLDPVDLITNADSIAARLGYDTCIEKNEPTPFHLVTHRLRTMLQLVHRSQHEPNEKKKMQISLIKATVQSYDKIAKANEATSEAAVRSIEVQVLLRLQYWASLGNTFAQMYKKLKMMRHKKKSRRADKQKGEKCDSIEAAQYLYNDIVDLLTMTAMKLPQDRPFPAFLRGCLDKSFNYGEPGSQLPKTVFQQIFDNFEVMDPDTMEIEEVVLFTSKVLPKRKKKRQPQLEAHPGLEGDKQNQSSTSNPLTTSSKKQPKNESSVGTGKSHNSLISQPLKLLAPGTMKKNSLFASGDARGHRSRFVGSHFNTNLTNTSSLFREVKAVMKKPTTSKARVSNKHTSKHVSSSRENQRQSNNKATSSKTRPLTTADNKLESQGSKRKQLHCFQTANAASSNKFQKVSFSKSKHPQETNQSLNKKGLGLDVKAARRVVVAARSALKRQS